MHCVAVARDVCVLHEEQTIIVTLEGVKFKKSLLACMCHALCCKGRVYCMRSRLSIFIVALQGPVGTDGLSCHSASATSRRTITCQTLRQSPGFGSLLALQSNQRCHVDTYCQRFKCNKSIGVVYWQKAGRICRNTVCVKKECVVPPLSLHHYFRRESPFKSMSAHAGISMTQAHAWWPDLTPRHCALHVYCMLIATQVTGPVAALTSEGTAVSGRLGNSSWH